MALRPGERNLRAWQIGVLVAVLREEVLKGYAQQLVKAD